MASILLVLAGLFEVGRAIGLKYTEGFTRFWPTVGTVAAMVVSLGLLGVAMKSLPVGNFLCGLGGCRRGGNRNSGHRAARRISQRRSPG
jgi:hypothetical protein